MTYIRGRVPKPEDYGVFLSEELTRIERAIKSLITASPQVTNVEPSNPSRGMVRYAVSPWDPIGTGFQGYVYHNGVRWVRLDDGGMTLIETVQANTGAMANTATLTVTYKEFVIKFANVAHSDANTQAIRIAISDDGTNFGTAANVTTAQANTTKFFGDIRVGNAHSNSVVKIITALTANTGGTASAFATTEMVETNLTKRLRFSPTNGNFANGVFYVYGIT